uniref:Protein MAK16 homolog n=1 Tax=Pseudo-nitzschia multistriata TaxID=183589 RepID=A0A448ZGS2_9STRA
MQNDEMIWQVINHQFCSYKRTIGKAKSDKTTFCQHPYSVTGLCNRTSCPLANSLYATLREENGKVFLCMKTVERAHSPKNLWEKVLLSRNYAKALAQIDEHLQYFPKALLHRNKQRLTKIHQYLLRMRKLKLKELSGHKAKIVQAPTRKIKQREERREQKALVAAKITNKIEQELVDRLANGTYGDIYNFEQTSFNKALGQVESDEEEMETEDESEEEESIVEYVEDLDSDEEESMEEDMEDFEYLGDGQWGRAESDSDESDDYDDDDDDDAESEDGDSKSEKKEDRKPKKKKKSSKKGSRVEIEYEEENDMEEEPMQEAGMAW